MIRTEKDIHSILTQKGHKAVEDGWNLAICINISKKKVSEVSFNESYANKLHSRTLKHYLQSLYQMNGQINTQVMKVMHNIVALDELIELGYIDKDKLSKVLPKLVDKFDCTKMYLQYFLTKDSDYLKRIYVVHHKGGAHHMPVEEFNDTFGAKNSGCWIEGSDKEQLKRMRAESKPKKCEYYLKNINNVVYAIRKKGREMLVLCLKLNFDHAKFLKENREKTWQELKDLVEYKRIEQDTEWFKQYMKQAEEV